MRNRGIIILSAQNENDKRRIGEALLFRSGWHAYDCCHATFDNVTMVIIIAAERKTESRSVTMAESVFLCWEIVVFSRVCYSVHA